jgi:hypothetical protein
VLQLLGFAGLLVCLALAIGLLLGRSFVSVAIGNVFTTVDTTIADGLASIDDATTRLSEGTGRLDELVGELGPLPATSPIPAAVAARVAGAVDSLGPARDRFADARNQARTALRILEATGRTVPEVAVPPGVATALDAADERLTRIDSALSGMRSSARATAGDVAAAATSLRDAVTSATDTARTLRGEVDGLRLRLVDVNVTIDRVLWLGTGALLAIVGYVALLNAIIVWLARRRPKAAPAVAVDPGAVGPNPGP